ncbi:MAG: septal ring lytic transglycosylase RlpA family protein [Candidatus Sumerlaeaceae bacterium]|nr:septal ring lytic transglycosylase RlpA family protein [Candidatus Sumerlaeaceae bacterium]
MEFLGFGARLVVLLTACVMALPIFGRSAEKSASISSTIKRGEARFSGQSSSPDGSASQKLASKSAKPNFYRETSQQTVQVTRPSGLTARTKRQTAKSTVPSSTVAGPTSVRRLQPAPDAFATVSHSPIGAKLTKAPSEPEAQAVQLGADTGPEEVTAANKKEGRWARLNPLRLFESRKPRLVPTGYVQTGIASWYGSDFHGGPTASGERYDMHSLTAAHPSLPFGTLLRVTNLRNGREVVVRVNNRGPYRRNRIIDLSKEAARQLGMVGAGLAKVQVEVLQAVEPIGQWGQQALQKLSSR